jgi:hypothetical protein
MALHPPGEAGHGYQCGPLRPDWGEGWADLRCDVCAATWVGPIGEPCEWCIRLAEDLCRWQAETVLRPPDDIDPDMHPTELRRRRDAWAQRLLVAVEAGLVSRQQAKGVATRWWQRVTGGSD